MKLITWNCHGAFRTKAPAIIACEPDILVVQECESPDKWNFPPGMWSPHDVYWHGDNPNKGTAVIAFADYRFELLDVFDPRFRYVVPLRVHGCGKEFTLFAIWTQANSTRYREQYIGQVWLAVNHYAVELRGSTILVGDFNSNTIWDDKDRVGNHTAVVTRLVEFGIESTYHRFRNEPQGKELQPTFYLHYNKDKPYHIDYCFASADFIATLEGVEAGSYEEWSMHSDHVPLLISFSD